MKYPFLILLAGLVFSSCAKEPAATSSRPGEYRIVAYVTGWKEFEFDSIAVEKLTHINYAFADVDSNFQVVSYLPNDMFNFAELKGLRLRNPDLKILISVGGWGRSKGFSDAALTANSRKIFAESAVDFVRRFELDGVDLDWEYPGQIGDNNPFRPEDKQNFTLMLREVRAELNRAAIMDNREDDPYLLTIATGASQTYLDHTEMHKAHRYLDFINIMTYDFAGDWVDTARHHANLFHSSQGLGSKIDAALAVQQHVDAGIPIEKIVLGVPFYGRWWAEVNPEGNGLNQPAKGGGGSFPFHTISQELVDKNGYARHWDEAAKAPFLWNDSTRTFLTYEDTTSLRLKAEFIKEKRMGGAMFWEYHADTTGTLLEVLHGNLN